MRVQNVLLIVIAFLIAAKYIFVPKTSFRGLLCDLNFILLIMATAITVASGYIINNFYDFKKDLINRPQKTILEQEVDQKKRLYLYFFFNFLAVALAGIISFRAAAFFSVYIFSIWFYSHKIKSYTFLANLMAAVLSIMPFFAIFLFFKQFSHFIFWHSVFLFLLLFIKELVKNFVNLKGDLIENNRSIPIEYGEKKAKNLIILVSLLLLIPIYILIGFEIIGNMKYYFILFLLIYSVGLIQFYNSKKNYHVFYALIKLLMFIGVFSVMLVNVK